MTDQQTAIEFKVLRTMDDNKGGYYDMVVRVPKAQAHLAREHFPGIGIKGGMVSLNDPDVYGPWWAELIRLSADIHKPSFFSDLDVLRHCGSDVKYQAYVRTQASIVSGDKNYTDEYPEGICEFAHVLRSNGVQGTGASGKSFKGDYCGVPLIRAEHHIQHNNGERECLDKFKPLSVMHGWQLQKASEFFERGVVAMRIGFVSRTIANDCGHKNRKTCPPSAVIQWLKDRSMMNRLPQKLLRGWS